ncbi:MAG: hypothetical protein GF355_05510 [Candidatus Eisenbacteria bacterium]|nr:hypothetical protein [Candidatus Eisenbacteria bacterium]
MTRGHFRTAALAIVSLLIGLSGSVMADRFVAVSMDRARMELEAGAQSKEIDRLGGMTHPIGLVYDRTRDDLILVGERVPGEDPVEVDDFAVALRAVLRHGTVPLVSIDRPAQSGKTGRQTVRFEGGIENTQFGADLFQADVILKRLGLGELKADVWGVPSYFDLTAEHWRRTGAEDDVHSRFWFVPSRQSTVASREDVAVVKKLQVNVKTEIISGPASGGAQATQDEIGDRFAARVAASYADLCGYYPALKRLDPLFRLAGLSEGFAEVGQDRSTARCLHYWLNDFPVRRTETPATYPLLERKEIVEGPSGERRLRIDGGIRLEALILELNDGDLGAFRDVVLASRPAASSLTWEVPLGGWQAPEGVIRQDAARDVETVARDYGDLGCCLGRQFSPVTGASPHTPGSVAWNRSPLSDPGRCFQTISNLPPRFEAPDVGGVMLTGAAGVAGDLPGMTTPGLANGGFSLVLEGQEAALSPAAFDRFMTALWAVYYSDEDPGISIDPIAPGIDKHMVRYIGRVVNSDLGRVMREADYVMKQWAVGTERPAIPGFRSPDDMAGRRGYTYLASSRFWFVPKDMRFRRAGGLLLFDGGRMTVQTEYLNAGARRTADPSNEEFARWFTREYDAIARRYPVYQELFDYAKMVSLAKYLKEQHVPLFWFLMANKDRVLTEDSPGTVDALARGSDYFKNLRIEGGVELVSPGSFVYDDGLRTALQSAGRRQGSGPTTELVSITEEDEDWARPAALTLDDVPYTLAPQHSLTTGTDARGVRYQTDLALHNASGPGLELVRYFDPSRPSGGEFGEGWRLLVPYRIEPAGDATREFLNAVIPERMSVVNLVTGEVETLSFSTDRYSIAGYVPGELSESQTVGLFLMSDASYRLADKLGNEFWFDPAGYMTDAVFSEDHRMHLEYRDGFTDQFAEMPYEVVPSGAEQAEYDGWLLPERMEVRNLINGETEIMEFSSEGRFVGYVTERERTGPYEMLVLMSDGSFRLLAGNGSEVAFDASGRFEGMTAAAGERLVASVSMGPHAAEFKYTVGRDGRPLIAEARLAGEGPREAEHLVIHYDYDSDGRLASATAAGLLADLSVGQ